MNMYSYVVNSVQYYSTVASKGNSYGNAQLCDEFRSAL